MHVYKQTCTFVNQAEMPKMSMVEFLLANYAEGRKIHEKEAILENGKRKLKLSTLNLSDVFSRGKHKSWFTSTFFSHIFKWHLKVILLEI